jgi:Tfp pilus assembly protein PilN
MFEINVHREALEQRQKARQQQFRVLLSRILYISLLVVLTGLFTFQLLHLRQNVSAKEEEMTKIHEMLEQHLPQDRGDLPAKVQILAWVKGNEVKWGEKLTILGSLLPARMWLEEITFEEKIIEGVKQEVFIISGATHLPEESEGLTDVLEFLDTLRESKDFSAGFQSVGLLSSRRNMTLEKKELNFELICIVR